MDEHILYLTSAHTPSHPNNTPSHFTNTLYSPILLPSNIRFQIGVLNCLYPKSYNILLVNDENSSILLYNQEEEVIETFTLPRNIVNGEDVEEIIELLNCPLLLWDAFLGRCELVFNNEEGSVSFGSRMATVLGFNCDHHYTKTGPAPRHPRTDDGGAEYLLCQSDVVLPTRFGDDMMSILDAFILEGAGGRGFTSTVYKTLNTFHLSSVTIKMVDQLQRPIHFDDLYSSTCVLHIRPIYNDYALNQATSLSQWTGNNA